MQPSPGTRGIRSSLDRTERGPRPGPAKGTAESGDYAALCWPCVSIAGSRCKSLAPCEFCIDASPNANQPVGIASILIMRGLEQVAPYQGQFEFPAEAPPEPRI